MPDPTSPDRPTRVARGVAATAGLLVLVAGCATGGERATAPDSPTAQPYTTPPAALTPTTTTPTPASDADTPLTAATRWLVAYYSASWTDGTPAAWIDRIRPYVTDTLNASNETLRTGGGGIDWAEFVRQHCTNSVTDTHAVIPPESPGTTTAANVQVTGTIHTTCSAGAPPRPTEQASATLVVIKTTDRWRVNQRLF